LYRKTIRRKVRHEGTNPAQQFISVGERSPPQKGEFIKKPVITEGQKEASFKGKRLRGREGKNAPVVLSGGKNTVTLSKKV